MSETVPPETPALAQEIAEIAHHIEAVVAEAVAAQPAAAPSRDIAGTIHSVIETWRATRIRNGAIAQHTDAWNHLAGALPALETALTEALT